MAPKSNILIPISICLAIVIAVTSLVNIGLNTTNTKLSDSIEILEDEKGNLRAKYLSEIALDKLDSKAGEMEMKYVSSKACYKISGEQLPKQKFTKPAKANAKKLSDEKILVTGY